MAPKASDSLPARRPLSAVFPYAPCLLTPDLLLLVYSYLLKEEGPFDLVVPNQSICLIYGRSRRRGNNEVDFVSFEMEVCGRNGKGARVPPHFFEFLAFLPDLIGQLCA